MYRKGIEVLKSDHKRYTATLNTVQANMVLKQQASALASIAELYMTEPLCDDSDAEQQCESSL